MVFPKSNLPAGSVPWGREVQKRIEDTDSKLASLAINDRSDTKQLQDSYRRLDKTVQGLKEADVKIVDALDLAQQAADDAQAAADEAQAAIDAITSLGSVGSSYSIYAGNISGGSITGITIRTAAAGTRVEMSGTSVTFYYGTEYVGKIVGSTDSWFDPTALVLYSGDENAYLSISSSSVGFEVFGDQSGYVFTSAGDTWIGASGTVYISGPVSLGATDTAALNVYGNLWVSGSNVAFPNITDSTAAANTRWGTTTGGRIFYSTASSARYKENIVDISTVEGLEPSKLLDLPVRAFRYKTDYQKNTEDSRYQVMIPGFIAEEVEQYYPLAADYEGEVVESWNERMIVPGLLALVQDLYKRIEILEGK